MQALIPDARAPGAGHQTIVERLLSITGEDSLTIDRKNKDPVTLTLRSRILLLSNEELQGPSHCTTESGRDDLGWGSEEMGAFAAPDVFQSLG